MPSEPIILRGTVANPGSFKGTAVVVEGFDIGEAQDFIRRNRGPFVLVAESTHVEYLPIMLKCIAFITEEGGLLSHAAITAREWGVPCVVGVKDLLGSVDTGDFVEGENGEIRVWKGC